MRKAGILARTLRIPYLAALDSIIIEESLWKHLIFDFVASDRPPLKISSCSFSRFRVTIRTDNPALLQVDLPGKAELHVVDLKNSEDAHLFGALPPTHVALPR